MAYHIDDVSPFRIGSYLFDSAVLAEYGGQIDRRVLDKETRTIWSREVLCAACWADGRGGGGGTGKATLNVEKWTTRDTFNKRWLIK